GVAPVLFAEHEAGEFARFDERADVVGPPAGQLAPGDEDQEGAEDQDRADHAPRHGAFRLLALLVDRPPPAPAGDREDREDDPEEEAVPGRRVAGVDPGEADPARPR